MIISQDSEISKTIMLVYHMICPMMCLAQAIHIINKSILSFYFEMKHFQLLQNLTVLNTKGDDRKKVHGTSHKIQKNNLSQIQSQNHQGVQQIC